MDQYVTGNTIKTLREKNNMTQLELAARLGVSDKTISKWETGKGYPDITLLEPIAEVFQISVTELISLSAILPAVTRPKSRPSSLVMGRAETLFRSL